MENDFNFEIVDQKGGFDFPEAAFMPKNDPAIKEGDGKEPEKIIADDTKLKTPEQQISSEDVEKAFDVKEDKEEGKKKEEVESDPTFKVLHDAFIKQGLLDKDEEFDGSEDSFVELFHKREEKQKETLYKQIGEELGDDGLALIRHLRAGGAPEDWAQTFSDPLKNVDLENQSHQKAVIRNYYERQGWEDADIEQELKDIEDLGEDKLKDKATKFHSKLQAQQKVEQENFVRNQETEETNRKNEFRKFTNEVSEIIDSSKDIMGVPIGRTAQPLKDYIFKPKVRLDNGQLVSQYVADRVKNASNKQLYVLNALLMMNGYKIPESLKAETTTKVTLGIKKQLEDARKQPTVPGKISNEDNENRPQSKSSVNWDDLFGRDNQ